MNFVKKYWPVILFSILGIVIGAIITKYRIESENKKLLDAITAQIASLQTKSQTSRITSSEQTTLIQKMAQAELLKTL